MERISRYSFNSSVKESSPYQRVLGSGNDSIGKEVKVNMTEYQHNTEQVDATDFERYNGYSRYMEKGQYYHEEQYRNNNNKNKNNSSIEICSTPELNFGQSGYNYSKPASKEQGLNHKSQYLEYSTKMRENFYETRTKREFEFVRDSTTNNVGTNYNSLYSTRYSSTGGESSSGSFTTNDGDDDHKYTNSLKRPRSYDMYQTSDEINSVDMKYRNRGKSNELSWAQAENAEGYKVRKLDSGDGGSGIDGRNVAEEPESYHTNPNEHNHNYSHEHQYRHETQLHYNDSHSSGNLYDSYYCDYYGNQKKNKKEFEDTRDDKRVKIVVETAPMILPTAIGERSKDDSLAAHQTNEGSLEYEMMDNPQHHHHHHHSLHQQRQSQHDQSSIHNTMLRSYGIPQPYFSHENLYEDVEDEDEDDDDEENQGIYKVDSRKSVYISPPRYKSYEMESDIQSLGLGKPPQEKTVTKSGLTTGDNVMSISNLIFAHDSIEDQRTGGDEHPREKKTTSNPLLGITDFIRTELEQLKTRDCTEPTTNKICDEDSSKTTTSVVKPQRRRKLSIGNNKKKKTDAPGKKPHENVAVQENVQVNNSDDKNQETLDVSTKLDIPKEAYAEAQSLYDQIKGTKTIQSRRPVQKKASIIAALLFIICKNKGYPRTFNEICSATKVSKRDIGMYYKLIKALVVLPGIETSEDSLTQHLNPNDFIKRWCMFMSLPEVVFNSAIFMYHKADQLNLVIGKCPVSIGATCIWLIVWCLQRLDFLIELDFKLPENTFVNSAGVPTVKSSPSAPPRKLLSLSSSLRPILSISASSASTSTPSPPSTTSPPSLPDSSYPYSGISLKDVCKVTNVTPTTLLSVFKLLLPSLHSLLPLTFVSDVSQLISLE
ncbi:Transcription initiation factor IIB [Zancudomyces culisetae]|uniref:Transcription initiation factor IIB n=1 Tax=Zancudomyces culisetae TaxID=1213189 RepID=A0A1R1PQ45_ZANCU|nr:Transcription initiation factor IIB [Zancudomyces culisetae]|eukprot:OMH83084.1 Transcription initiation factor IIB [Zancudomyces culisetae]